MSTVVYDAAVLVAADKNERRAWAEHKARLELGVVPLVPAPVVVQVSRPPHQFGSIAPPPHRFRITSSTPPMMVRPGIATPGMDWYEVLVTLLTSRYGCSFLRGSAA